MILEDTMECSLTGADPGASLQSINQYGIEVTGLRWEGPLTVRFFCKSRYRKKLLYICGKRGDALRIIGERGPWVSLQAVCHRPVLVAVFFLLLTLTVILPAKVLFVRVEGNDRIPSRQILEAAEVCGIRFGASRQQVRSEKMKNSLLSAMPELKWAGINTSGCTAVISVRERDPEQEKKETAGFSGIAACRDGYITSCTAVKGTALCVPGQSVLKGQMLISGFTDCGSHILVSEAEGEVYAQTRRNLRVRSPGNCLIRTEEREVSRKISLRLGKKRINFWKGSGISPTSCGRMYEEYYVTLPGGFRLPLGIGIETLTQWETIPETVDPEQESEPMAQWAESLILKEMVAGKILDRIFSYSDSGDLRAWFLCEEMIGRVITEEIGDINGKTD